MSAAQRQTHTPEAAAAGTHSPCAQHALHPELAANQSLAFCTKPSNGKFILTGVQHAGRVSVQNSRTIYKLIC